MCFLLGESASKLIVCCKTYHFAIWCLQHLCGWRRLVLIKMCYLCSSFMKIRETDMLQFLKNWTLPVAMVAGVLGYLFFARVPLMAPLKPLVLDVVDVLTPLLIFFQLLLTFCKIDFNDLKPAGWHLWLLCFQLLACLGIAGVLLYCTMDEVYREVFEGAMVCLICPTATAAAVITGKLGGNAASLTTYTLLSNLLAAVVVPLIFPLVEPHSGLSFWASFLLILSKVFPLLLCPFILAVLLRRCLPSVHVWLGSVSHVAFYIWGIALAIVCGQTLRSLLNSTAPAYVEWLLALSALLACGVQFALGKHVGSIYKERISGGQALGQKNTVLAIWMAYTYLNPLSSVAPGAYVLWQNVFNSYQLWKKRKNEGC